MAFDSSQYLSLAFIMQILWVLYIIVSEIVLFFCSHFGPLVLHMHEHNWSLCYICNVSSVALGFWEFCGSMHVQLWVSLSSSLEPTGFWAHRLFSQNLRLFQASFLILHFLISFSKAPIVWVWIHFFVSHRQANLKGTPLASVILLWITQEHFSEFLSKSLYILSP